MSRTEILSRIRFSLRNRRETLLPQELPQMPRYDDPATVFSERLTQVGGIVLDSRTREMQACLEQVLADTGAETICWEEQATLDNHAIPHHRVGAAFEREKLVLSTHPGGRVEFPLQLTTRSLNMKQVESAPLSAGSAEIGIAETGTILFRSGERRSRLLFGLAPCRLTFLSENSILNNLDEAVRRGLPVSESAILTWATGPSRTADIEKRLVKGVHGPGRWFVIITR